MDDDYELSLAALVSTTLGLSEVSSIGDNSLDSHDPAVLDRDYDGGVTDAEYGQIRAEKYKNYSRREM
ncbi:hypothetical protein [Candidatus Nanohalobium constans]|uniref:Uncharacterized protein n=1 Tax=Candidatus Nanohalobium constans TaxID=2565781 RepID=A0A5Q0UES4_9ARCH|nr:hypothetical protein [Candidatus Nanohalobium constans]QGA80048.1 hypothetical protein LC1Nh_0140 [Candidatus Nanohalobium constans]